MRHLKQWQVLGLVLVVFVMIGWQLIKPDLPAYPPYVSHSPAADGVKALYTWLEEQGEQVAQWKRPWEMLPDGPDQLLVLVQPMAAVSRMEQEHLEVWMSQGNEVLWLDAKPHLSALFLETIEVPGDDEPAAIEHAQWDGNWSAVVPVETRFADLDAATGWTGIFGDHAGYLAVSKQFGAGRMTVGLVPEWATNRWIARESHLALLGLSLQEREHRAIWFDEYHHGLQSSGGVWGVMPAAIKLMVWPLLAAVLLWLWRSSVRFGVAHTPRAWQVRRGDETLLATGGWYARQRLTVEALQWQAAYVRSLLSQHLGLRQDADQDQIMAVARTRMGAREAEQLSALLAAWRAAEQSPVYSDKDFVRDSRLADEVIDNLERM